MPGRRDFQVGEHRRRLFGEACRRVRARARAVRGTAGTAARLRASAPRVAALACATVLLCTMKSATCSRTRANGCERLVGVDRQFREHVVLAGEDREHLVEFLQRRVGALDDFAEVAAASGEAGAEFVEDDRQALAFGQAVDVAEQVDVDRAVGVLHRQQVLAGAFLPLADLVQRRRQRRAFDARLGRQAVDVLLADQRLRADRAARVRAEVLEAGVFDVAARPPPWPAASASTEPTVPTLTPSILTFSPEIRLPASSKIARTV